MLSLLQPKANITASESEQETYELVLFHLSILGSICIVLCINCVLLLTLRSKSVFCETSRFILLYNLLLADTINLVSCLLIYFFSSLQIQMNYYACGVLLLFPMLMHPISPMMLAVMSIERYVAVCHPLRHATIFTMRSTGMAIAVVWLTSVIPILIRIFILSHMFTKINGGLQMVEFCTKEMIFYLPIFHDFEKVHAGTLFLSVGLVIIGSYTGVALAARLASTDKASARKALHTLSLHLIQLSLILCASMHTTILTVIATNVGRSTLLRVYNVCFVIFSVLPRCLSALIYGLRDQTIRPIFMKNLCCWWRGSVCLNKSR